MNNLIYIVFNQYLYKTMGLKYTRNNSGLPEQKAFGLFDNTEYNFSYKNITGGFKVIVERYNDYGSNEYQYGSNTSSRSNSDSSS